MTCVIFCGAEITDIEYTKGYLDQAALVISADSGARHCRALGIAPDILVGDFDSIDKNDHDAFKNAGTEVLRFPEEKDMTDSELAVEIAISKGCKRVIMLGATGARLDHSISNLFLLKKLTDADVEGMIADEKTEVRLIDDEIRLKREEGVFVTLLPVAGNAYGVTTRGLYYPLDNATLVTGSSRGVSNRFSDEEAYIKVRDGYLLVIMNRE